MPHFVMDFSKNKIKEYHIPEGYFYTMLLNDCLLSNPEHHMLSENFLQQTEFVISLDRFWFCLTGLKKNIYHGVYGWNVEDYMELFDFYKNSAESVIRDMGYRTNIFMLLEGDVKQMAILFSPKASPLCTPEELAEKIVLLGQRIYQKEMFHGDSRYCNVAALSGELHGFRGIREGFLQTRQLNDLSYFHMEPVVLTSDRIARLRSQEDYPSVIEACGRLCQAMDYGRTGECRLLLEQLFLVRLKHSYSWPLLQNALSYCRYALQVRRTARGLVPADLDQLYQAGSFLRIEECMEALWTPVKEVCEAADREGVRSEFVQRALYYIKLHYMEDISRTEIARYVNVASSYLSTIFHEETGLSIREYISRERIEAAKRMLSHGKARVSDISEAVGIHDTKYFTQMFKKATGMTPAQYRQINKETA